MNVHKHFFSGLCALALACVAAGCAADNNSNTANTTTTTTTSTTSTEGRRTARVTMRSGESRDLPEDKVTTALDATGDALASAAGFVVDKAKDAAQAVKEGGATVIYKT